mgnify:CR=1 FL=1
MSFECPHCSKAIENVVSKQTFDERVSKLSEGKKAAEEKASKLQALADRAAPLAAKAHGYETDADTLETLQARYEKSVKNGYTADFSDWLGDSEGAAKDSVAARFRTAPAPAPAQAPKAEAPKAETPPAALPAARVPSTPTTTSTTAPPQVGWTEAQVKAANDRLLVEYSKATPERRAAIKTEMETNRQKIAPVT